MKKFWALALALLIAILSASCSKKAESADSPADNPGDSLPLAEIVGTVLEGIPDLPAYEPMELDEENFEFFAFIPHQPGFEGIMADALIGTIPHSVVLIRLPDAAGAKKAADEILSKADVRKWICVEAESAQTAHKGRLVLLVMSSRDTADAIIDSFNKNI
jgi:hypothetical protein